MNPNSKEDFYPEFPFFGTPFKKKLTEPLPSPSKISRHESSGPEIPVYPRISFFHKIPPEKWNDWRWQICNRITTVSELEKWFPISAEEKRAIHFSREHFHFSLTPYWATQMDPNNFFCPIRRQSIPLDDELRVSSHNESELNPELPRCSNSKLIHLHRDRAILSIHSRCVLYCRFCSQKKINGEKKPDEIHEFPALSEEEWKKVSRYLKEHPHIREIILSGGEPLLLNNEILFDVFSRLKTIPFIKTFRLETRMISVLPQRITPSLIQILKKFQPLYLVLHVNHPREITPEFIDAVTRLADAGIPLVSQTTLLRGINDRSQTLHELFLALFHLRIRPYRLIQSFISQGAEHFRTSISHGLKLTESLRGRVTGLSLPEYVVDTLGGKIPLKYETILSRNRKRVLLKNYEGKIFIVPEKNMSNPS